MTALPAGAAGGRYGAFRAAGRRGDRPAGAQGDRLLAAADAGGAAGSGAAGRAGVLALAQPRAPARLAACRASAGEYRFAAAGVGPACARASVRQRPARGPARPGPAARRRTAGLVGMARPGLARRLRRRLPHCRRRAARSGAGGRQPGRDEHRQRAGRALRRRPAPAAPVSRRDLPPHRGGSARAAAAVPGAHRTGPDARAGYRLQRPTRGRRDSAGGVRRRGPGASGGRRERGGWPGDRGWPAGALRSPADRPRRVRQRGRAGLAPGPAGGRRHAAAAVGGRTDALRGESIECEPSLDPLRVSGTFPSTTCRWPWRCWRRPMACASCTKVGGC